jgi:CheY-like chemotaxis protein
MATILVVEDNDDVREMMTVALELEGHDVQAAANGRQALAQLENGLRPCVILLDLMMPVMNGWEFRSALKRDERFKDIPVIVISAVGSDLGSLGIGCFLPKPVDVDTLLSVVCEACDSAVERGIPQSPTRSKVS